MVKHSEEQIVKFSNDETTTIVDAHLVIVSPHYMDIRGDCSKVLICLAITQVARAEYLLNLPGYEQFLELGG